MVTLWLKQPTCLDSLERETVHWRCSSFARQVNSTNIYSLIRYPGIHYQAAWCLWHYLGNYITVGKSSDFPVKKNTKHRMWVSKRAHVYRNGLKWQSALWLNSMASDILFSTKNYVFTIHILKEVGRETMNCTMFITSAISAAHCICITKCRCFRWRVNCVTAGKSICTSHKATT